MEAKKKAGLIIIIALIVIAFFMQIVSLIRSEVLVTDRLLNGALIVGLLSALLYACAGYEKNVAKYYKVFMMIYAAAMVYSVVAGILYASAHGISKPVILASSIPTVIASLLAIFLAFIKNLGKKLSTMFATLILILVCCALLYRVIVLGDFAPYYSIYIGNVILTVMVFLFVKNKYADKDRRGTT